MIVYVECPWCGYFQHDLPLSNADTAVPSECLIPRDFIPAVLKAKVEALVCPRCGYQPKPEERDSVGA